MPRKKGNEAVGLVVMPTGLLKNSDEVGGRLFRFFARVLANV